ncbi:MAG: carboxypeptidase regulatory-like domain-containing protein [Prevotella sp.]|nr:carboxypeptidase regulatory-like domain-containing protein [Prevotella sp.]
MKADNDLIEADNTSTALAITMLPLGSSEEVNIGQRESTSTDHPLNLYYKYGASQNIYSADEIGIPRGRISNILTSYSCYSDLTNAAVKIYLSNTDRVSNADGWIPLDEYALVFDGHIDISSSKTVLDFELQNAFDYEGGNIAMLVVTSLADASRSYLSMSQPYYTSPLAGNSAIGYGNDSNQFDFTKSFTSRRGNSCVTFMMRSGGAAVTGFVTDSGNNPVEGAEVAIPEIRASTKSGADGSFRFDFVPNGEFSIQAKMFGYKDSEAAKITVSDNDASTTIRIEKLPVYTVSGRVLSPDGNALGEADITLAGYTDLATTSNTDGTFSFSDVVVSDETTVTVSKDRYVDYTETFNLNANKDLGDITLGYAHFAPAGITVATSDNAASLTWNSPSAETDFIYDSGKADTQIGFSESIGTIVIGTAFRTPMTLNSISWFTTSEGGPHNSVNVYIYDLDEEGNPTGTMLYSERAVRNTDGQWTELTLENPVDAPRGCFVALNYPGFHGIGVDGDHKAFPFRENTYAFSTDYSSGDFAYFDSETLSGNLMIRAAGNAWSAEEMKPAASDAPEICTYNVWRASGYGSYDWTSLNSSPLTTTSFSDATWQNAPAGVYRYADASRTFAEADFAFPGRTQPCSFMVFNPSKTTPSMADQRRASIPYEGDAELASFAGYSGSDDWFISPRLTYHNDFTLKFMARGYSLTYGEVIRVGYSTTDTDPMSFTWIADRVDVPMQVWTEFEYTVPAAARYVAINCISPDGFTLFIDNVEISSGNGFEMNTAVSGPEVIYAVSLDGEELARTTDCSFMLSDVAKGAHTAEVKAVYASGESAPATVRFGETGLNGLNGSEISVWPNPAPGYTIVRGDFSRATIHDLSGRSLKTFDGTEKRLDLSGFAHGIYLLVIETEDNRTTTIKLAVR